MIGRGQVETQHPEDRRQDAFSLPQGQVDDEPARQRGFDGEIGILPLPATRAAADVKRLRQLEQENGRLKKMVADRDLEIDVLKEITRKKNSRRTCAPAAGRVCAPTRAVEPPGVRRVVGLSVDTGLRVSAPAARCAGISGHA